MRDDLRRIDAFLRALELRLCTRTETFAYGTAYLNVDVPRRWDSNFLWAESPLGGVTADALAAEAERLLGGAGLAHREVVTHDDAAGERLAPRFVELGWKTDHTVTMVLRRAPDRPTDADVRQVGFAEACGRGLARAVVTAAVDAAHARGCDLIFIGADVDDWPQQLYGKLGFDPVARDWTFRRPPPEAR